MIEKNSYLTHVYQTVLEKAKTESVFIDFDKGIMTYHDLLSRVNHIASLFSDLQLVRGDRVIIFTNYDRHAISLFVAALLDGLTPILLSTDTKSHRLEAIVGKVMPKLIFIDAGFARTWPWIEEHNCIRILEKQTGQQYDSLSRKSSKERLLLPYPEILNSYEECKPRCDAAPDDIAFILFTSGTTSTPKGILVTHANLFEHLKTIIRIFAYDVSNKIFNNMALAHADGLVQGPLLALYSGAILFRPEGFAIQNLEKLLTKVKNKEITHLITVPTILSLVDRFLKRDDYFSNKAFVNLVSVAAKINPELWKRLQDRFKIRICNIYGLTETVSGGVFCGPGDETFSIGTIGKPVDMEARIVDHEGQDCVPGKEGELWLRGVNVIPGYLDEPEATSLLFSGDWLRTGDLAKKDSNGFFHIVGRIKSVIVSGGYNIHPDEVNEVLLLHPDVIDAATISIEDKDWGELVASAVESDILLDENILINHCRMYLESIKVPKKIVQINKLPRGISGKVKLRALQEVLQDGGRESLSSYTPEMEDIVSLAATVFNTPAENIDQDLPSGEIPGWDSLGHLNLIAAVESKYDVEFDVEKMMQVDSLRTLRDLLILISQKYVEPKKRKSVTLSPLSLKEYETMQRVVASIRVGEKQAGSLMLAMNTGGYKKPLYWCFNALDYEFGRLAANLGREQPLFALYSGAGVLGKSISRDHLAEHYVNELLEHSPNEIFTIGGNCRGATIAWRMVQRLNEKGARVDKVCLLEYFSSEMYQEIQGEMLLLFGKQSPILYPQQFSWQQNGWEKKFQKVPQVDMTPGTHGDFFTDENITPLVSRISRFLYDEAE